MISKKTFIYKIIYFLLLLHYFPHLYSVKSLKEPFIEGINVKITKYPKILCVILSHPTKETSTLNHIIRTWLAHCDKSLFITTTREKLHDRREKMNIEVVKIISEGKKMNIWKKTIESLKIVHNMFFRNNKNQFDWLLKVNDNSFVIIENLKRFLINKDENKSIYYGFNSSYNNINNEMKYNEEYISGGSGYVISRGGIKKLAEKNFTFVDNCNKKETNGFEDIIIGRCFRKFGIEGGDSKDEYGFETFLPPVPKKNYILTLSKSGEMYSMFPGDKYECEKLSQYPISFHNIVPENIYILYFIFYKSKVYDGQYEE
uniref:N-acetylgalactosaminide beta-1,3-galactosyltransferase n=1 Tax=Strongyloides venezuelensis TaxID=75913 RepID=A0A0K0F7N3_STRVS